MAVEKVEEKLPYIVNDAPYVPDDVYPLHTLDYNPAYVDWVMLFNDVLDPNMLKRSLSRLLEIGDWRKMGGRFQYNKDGKLEILVPGSSAGPRENISFTNDVIDSTMVDHPVARKLPVRTDGPSIHQITDDFRPFDGRPNFPKFEEMTRKDIPPISVHVTSFNDGTIVALSWPHQLMDAMAGKQLLAGWSSVLAGHEDEVPEVLGAREDICNHPEMRRAEEEELMIEKSRLTGAGLLMLKLRFVWDYLWHGARERRLIYLPKESLMKMKAQVKQELVASAPDVETAPWVTENDILTAWAAKCLAESESSSRPITILNFLNLRFRVPILARSTGVFLQNIVVGTLTFLSPQKARAPLAEVALENRAHIAEQGTEVQGRLVMDMVMKEIEQDRAPSMVFGPSNAVHLIVNNLLKVGIMTSVKFGPAVVQQGESSETRRNPLGTMFTYYHAYLDHMYDAFNCFIMFGKDQSDDYWIGGALLPRAWKIVERELQTL